MSWFRRKGADADAESQAERSATSDADEVADEVTGSAESTEEEAAERARLVRLSEREQAETTRRESGPLDEAEVDDEITRIDLGALRVPPREGMELRLEIDEKSKRVTAATITLSGSSVQLQAFAAPRTEGVWDDIRSEIAAQVTRQGGTADEITGTFGREVLARIPARTPDGRTGHQIARFTGVDGPRWFLRAVFHGKAAVDEDAATELEQVVRGTVVVRGGEARPPRDLLALTLPAQPGQVQPPDDGDGAGGAANSSLDPLRRGPEITEIH